MVKYLFLSFLFCFIAKNINAQQDLAFLISDDICKCLNQSADTSKIAYSKCYSYAFTKYYKQICTEYNLTPNSSYEAGKEAGKKMQGRVLTILNQNCEEYRKRNRRGKE